jgi:NAD(P)-dependent dehydrogenase (short-subunit alcohol dehydrogenase family)
MGVNFYGALYGVRTFIPRMIEQKTISHVVNVSSLSGMIAGGKAYGVSKQAIIALTESLYFELANDAPHVKVSVYCPGRVNSEIDTIDRSRPKRFCTKATLPTDEQRVKMRRAQAAGISIEESGRILFVGIQENKLYIGPKTFHKQYPGLTSRVRERAENMLNEHNPVPNSNVKYFVQNSQS